MPHIRTFQDHYLSANNGDLSPGDGTNRGAGPGQWGWRVHTVAQSGPPNLDLEQFSVFPIEDGWCHICDWYGNFLSPNNGDLSPGSTGGGPGSRGWRVHTVPRHGLPAQDFERFQLVPLGDDLYFIQTFNGHYLSPNNGDLSPNTEGASGHGPAPGQWGWRIHTVPDGSEFEKFRIEFPKTRPVGNFQNNPILIGNYAMVLQSGSIQLAGQGTTGSIMVRNEAEKPLTIVAGSLAIDIPPGEAAALNNAPTEIVYDIGRYSQSGQLQIISADNKNSADARPQGYTFCIAFKGDGGSLSLR